MNQPCEQDPPPTRLGLQIRLPAQNIRSASDHDGLINHPRLCVVASCDVPMLLSNARWTHVMVVPEQSLQKTVVADQSTYPRNRLVLSTASPFQAVESTQQSTGSIRSPIKTPTVISQTSFALLMRMASSHHRHQAVIAATSDKDQFRRASAWAVFRGTSS